MLYGWLPGSSPPFGRIFTFADAAHAHGLDSYWPGGSKLPAIQRLLEGAFERACMGPLILTVVREAIKYRDKKGAPLTREEIRNLDGLLQNLGCRLRELADPAFLRSLPSSGTNTRPIDGKIVAPSRLRELHEKYKLMETNPDVQNRGYELQELLAELLDAFGLGPRRPFRVIGEEIDGSFVLDGEVYLLEARWRRKKAAKADLSAFADKVERKSGWTRGLFVSIGGFSEDSLEAMKMGKAPNFVVLSGAELLRAMLGEAGLVDLLREKVRRLAELGELHVTQ